MECARNEAWLESQKQPGQYFKKKNKVKEIVVDSSPADIGLNFNTLHASYG